LFDRTGHGFIDGSDLGRALRALGQNPSEEDVAKMLSDAKLDGRYEQLYLNLVNHSSRALIRLMGITLLKFFLNEVIIGNQFFNYKIMVLY